MENPLQRKPTKRSKQKKKPVRVVYISNPMKIRTCASRFRSLVQELTGQDAELPNRTKFMDADDDVDSNQTTPDATKIVGDDRGAVVPTVVEAEQEKAVERNNDGDLDDDFTQLLENLAPSFYYESVHTDIPRDW
ncbi:hypothetical protein SLE2022_061380 [Rubroshorea leprosula]